MRGSAQHSKFSPTCQVASWRQKQLDLFKVLLVPWAPQCHNGLHGSTVPCRITTALWLHEALECSNGLLVPQSPAASHWGLGTMRPSHATMIFLVPRGPYSVTMAPCFHGPQSVTMVSMDPRCPAGSPRLFGYRRPCNAAMASWFHKALLLHTGPLGPWGPAVPQ